MPFAAVVALGACDARPQSVEPDPPATEAPLAKKVGKPATGRGLYKRMRGVRTALLSGPGQKHFAYLGPAQPGRTVPLSSAVVDGLASWARHARGELRLSLDTQRATIEVFHGTLTQPYGTGPDAARRFAEDALPTLGLRGSEAEGATLEPMRVLRDDDGATHAAYQLHIDGLPVFRSEVVVHLDAEGLVRSVQSGGLGRVDGDAGVRRVDAAAATQLARAAAGPAPDIAGLPELPTPEAGLWPQDSGDIVPAMRVYLHALHTEQDYQTYAVYVDTVQGEVLAMHAERYTDSPTPASGTAQAPGGNTVPLALSYYDEHDKYALLDQSRGTAAGLSVTLHGAHNTSALDDALVVSSSRDTWEADSALIHNHLTQCVDYFKRVHGRNGWDGQGSDAVAVSHYGRDYNNAHWSRWAKVMSIGDGDNRRFVPLGRSLDVLVHEFSHAVVDATVGLVYQNQSGALNESFADVMSAMVDREDYKLGEDMVGPDFGRDALRSLEDPAAYGYPAHMRDYDNSGWDNGGVHINSSITNHAAYLAAEAVGRDVVEKVWYRTLQQHHVTGTATFKQMALGTLAACEELVRQRKLQSTDCTAIMQSWAGVGVLGLSDVPGGGCPDNAKERMGVCLCDNDYTPSADGQRCIAFADVSCPEHAVATQGQCFCLDGYAPDEDFSACVAVDNACPPNSDWDDMLGRCVCSEGFEGDPDAADGECNAVDSDCGEHMHPEWQSDPEDNPDDYQCLCNDGFELAGDGLSCVVPLGGCGNESFYGRCQGQTLVYCGPDGIEEVDCGGAGLTCGLFDSLIGYDCLNPAGLGPAERCDPDAYQECGADDPFCVQDAAGDGAFCSHECKTDRDCGDAYGCCASVSDGTRACLTDAYCASAVDVSATCDDVPGGSTYAGSCEGNVLRFCDGSSSTTREVICAQLDLVCAETASGDGFDCVPKDQAGFGAEPGVFCPFEQDGACDVPARCPEGSDLLDCNPCGDVPEQGACDGDSFERCDGRAGLVSVDCTELAEGRCGQDDMGRPACVQGPAPSGEPDAGAPGRDAGMEPEPEPEPEPKSVSCSCRALGAGPGHGDRPLSLSLSLLLLAALRLSRRKRAR